MVIVSHYSFFQCVHVHFIKSNVKVPLSEREVNMPHAASPFSMWLNFNPLFYRHTTNNWLPTVYYEEVASVLKCNHGNIKLNKNDGCIITEWIPPEMRNDWPGGYTPGHRSIPCHITYQTNHKKIWCTILGYRFIQVFRTRIQQLKAIVYCPIYDPMTSYKVTPCRYGRKNTFLIILGHNLVKLHKSSIAILGFGLWISRAVYLGLNKILDIVPTVCGLEVMEIRGWAMGIWKLLILTKWIWSSITITDLSCRIQKIILHIYRGIQIG